MPLANFPTRLGEEAQGPKGSAKKADCMPLPDRLPVDLDLQGPRVAAGGFEELKP